MDMPVHFVGLMMLITPVTMIFISVMAGRLTVKYDERVISGAALFVLLAAIVIFMFISRVSFEMIILGCVLQGIGQGFFSSPNNKYVLTVVDKEDLADSSSFLAASKEFGKIVSTGTYTLLFAIFFGNKMLGSKGLDPLLIHTDFIMMALTVIMCISTILAIFFNIMKYDNTPSVDVLRFFNSLKPRRFKDVDLLKKYNIK